MKIGFFGLIFLLFLGLKLGEVGTVATWSWWAVAAPLWGPVALTGCYVFAVICLGLIGLALKSIAGR